MNEDLQQAHDDLNDAIEHIGEGRLMEAAVAATSAAYKLMSRATEQCGTVTIVSTIVSTNRKYEGRS